MLRGAGQPHLTGVRHKKVTIIIQRNVSKLKTRLFYIINREMKHERLSDSLHTEHLFISPVYTHLLQAVQSLSSEEII